jgi:parallel beta-helix repeat protein
MSKLVIVSVIISLFSFAFGTAFGTTIYVPDDHMTIQDAIDASSNGDTVIVRSGTYTENINFLGKGILLKSEQGPRSTTIDGGSPSNPDSASVVTFINGEDSSSVLEGFTIKKGKGNKSHMFKYGGGIYCELSSPTITGNTVTENSATYGGGIYCDDSYPEISDNNIVDNSVTFSGAGIYCSGSSPVISGNTISVNRTGGGVHLTSSSAPLIYNNSITENSCRDFGGGIMCFVSSPTIVNNTIALNTADGGGGISISSSSPIIANNIVFENSAEDSSSGGGGILLRDHSDPTIMNNTIEGNLAILDGGGIQCLQSTPVITNTILWGNDAPTGREMSIGDTSALSISYSNVEYGIDSVFVESGSSIDWGDGMIDEYPLFANSEYHLQPHAPCVDAGDTSILDACLPPGLGGDRSDMGAYGGEDNCGWPVKAIDLFLDPAGPVAVSKGDTLYFTTDILNNTGNTVAGDFWLSVLLPNSNEIVIPENILNYSNPLSGQIAPLGSIFLDYELFVPVGVGTGNYKLVGRVGLYPNTEINKKWLDFEVIE